MSDTWKQRIDTFWHEWAKPILVVLFVVGSFRSAIADWNDVPTGSMKPTILEGDRIFVNKVAYDLKIPFTGLRLIEWGEPERGDIVVFSSPADEKRLVKRIVAIPGDQIQMVDKRLLINGQPADYGPIDPSLIAELDPTDHEGYAIFREEIDGIGHPVMVDPDRAGFAATFGPVAVPDGQFFAMGDNRDNSLDSRWFGFVEGERIVGQATAIALSVDPDHYYLPRWGRFFSSLD